MIEQKIEQNKGFMEKLRGTLRKNFVVYAIAAALSLGASACEKYESCYIPNGCDKCSSYDDCNCSKPEGAPNSECSCTCTYNGKWQTSYEPLMQEQLYDTLDTMDLFSE